MRKTWKRIVQILLDKDAEHIMKKVNRDPSLKDVQAPDGLYDKILDQIREYEEAQEKEKEQFIKAFVNDYTPMEINYAVAKEMDKGVGSYV